MTNNNPYEDWSTEILHSKEVTDSLVRFLCRKGVPFPQANQLVPDALHDGLVHALQMPHNFWQHYHHFRNAVVQAAQRRLIDGYRHSQREQALNEEEASLVHAQGEEPSGDEWVIRMGCEELLLWEQELIEEAYQEGLTLQEMAARLPADDRSAKARLSDVYRRLEAIREWLGLRVRTCRRWMENAGIASYTDVSERLLAHMAWEAEALTAPPRRRSREQLRSELIAIGGTLGGRTEYLVLQPRGETAPVVGRRIANHLYGDPERHFRLRLAWAAAVGASGQVQPSLEVTPAPTHGCLRIHVFFSEDLRRTFSLPVSSPLQTPPVDEWARSEPCEAIPLAAVPSKDPVCWWALPTWPPEMRLST